MTEKHRNLPPWMVKSDAQSSKDKDAEKKKRTAKKKLKSVVAYWMNEKELVETALDMLKNDSTCARDAGQAPEEVMVIPETDEDSSDSDVQDRSRASIIAEQETVPYGNCAEESTSTKPDCHFRPASDGSGAEDKPDVDDEALELVREIFFT